MADVTLCVRRPHDRVLEEAGFEVCDVEEHRVNVFNPGWDRVGIAVLRADEGSAWATQEFARSAGVDLPSVDSTTPTAEPVVRPEEDGPRCS